MRAVLARRARDPPAVLLLDTFAWRAWSCKEGDCRYGELCDGMFHELASFYHLSVVSRTTHKCTTATPCTFPRCAAESVHTVCAA